MGCHTWFFAKIEDFSKKELNFLKRETIRGVKFWCDYPTFEEWKETEQELADDMLEYAEYWKGDGGDMIKYERCMKERRKYLNPSKKKWRQYRYNKKYILKKLTAKSLSRSECIRVIRKAKEFIFRKDPHGRKGWYCDRVFGYSDNFRIYDYDAEPWLCYEDFMKYLEEHPDRKVDVFEYNKETEKFDRREDSVEIAKQVVKEFFEKHPDGYIELG